MSGYTILIIRKLIFFITRPMKGCGFIITTTNKEIRIAMAESGLKYFELAEKLGIHESNMSRFLRKELTAEKKKEVLDVINEIIMEREGL